MATLMESTTIVAQAVPYPLPCLVALVRMCGPIPLGTTETAIVLSRNQTRIKGATNQDVGLLSRYV